MTEDNVTSSFHSCPVAAISVSGTLDALAITELKTFQLEAYGIVGNLLSTVGFVFNSLSIYVLRDRRVCSSTAVYLMALAVYDFIILMAMVLFFGLPALRSWGPALEAYYHVFRVAVPLGYPVSLAAHMGSIYICVAFTVDRYMAVCRPLELDCVISRRRRAQRWVGVISAVAVLFNLPRCFQYQTFWCWNVFTNRSLAVQRETEFGQSGPFKTGYLIYLHLAVMFAFPCLVLAVLNTALMSAIRKSQKLRKEMSRMRMRERNLTLMLMSLTGVFVICQLPSIVDNILVASMGHDVLVVNLTYMKFYTLSTLLVHVNSCVNFILYMAFGQRFRYVLRTKLTSCALSRRLRLRKSKLHILSPTALARPVRRFQEDIHDEDGIEMADFDNIPGDYRHLGNLDRERQFDDDEDGDGDGDESFGGNRCR